MGSQELNSFVGLTFLETVKKEESHVRWQGSMTEDFDPRIQSLIALLKKNAVFNFADLELITSIGIRLWINFMREVEVGRVIRFAHCPAEFIYQINNIPMVKGSARIESFYGNFACEKCDTDFRSLFEPGSEIKHLVDLIESTRCPSCGSVAELEALTEEFLEFLSYP